MDTLLLDKVIVVCAAAVGLVCSYWLNRLSEYLDRRPSSSDQKFKDLYAQWRVFLLNVRIAKCQSFVE